MECMVQSRKKKIVCLIQACSSEHSTPILDEPVLAASNWSVATQGQQPHLTKNYTLLKFANIILQQFVSTS